MDHLPKFHYATDPYPKIPYLCLEPFDNGEFQGYPARKGWSDTGIAAGECVQAHSPAEVAEFLQCWLYFGTLNELHATGGAKVKASKVVQKDEEGKETVTSANLEKYIKGWADKLKGTRQSKQKRRLDRITDVLDRVCSVSDNLFLKHVEEPAETHPPLEVILSIKVLGSTIDNALIDNGLVETIRGWNLALAAIPRMIDSGWCPRDIAVARSFLSDLSMYCASYVQRDWNGKDQDHSKCNDITCKFNQVDEGVYKTQHRTPDCECEFWGPELETIKQTIRDGMIPVIVMKPAKLKDGTRSLQLELEGQKDSPHWAPGRHFSIFSHVWSDGLGNPHRNALPMCQLAFFYDILQNVSMDGSLKPQSNGGILVGSPLKGSSYLNPNTYRGSVREFFGRPVKVWLDTLCVPLDEEMRKIAISDLKRYYSTADLTVVLDAELVRLEHKACSEEEILIRIALSGWMRRCWTFQEGVIGSITLRVLFADGFYNLPKAVSSVQQMNSIAPFLQSDVWKQIHKKSVERNEMIRDGLTAAAIIVNVYSIARMCADPRATIKMLSQNGGVPPGVRRAGSRVTYPFSKEEDPFAVQTTAAHFCAEAKSCFLAIAAMWTDQPEPSSPEYLQDRLHRIVVAWEGLHFRTTSRASDRLVNFMFACAKNENDFKSLGRILGLPKDERFQAWISDQPALPSGLLFVQGPKMTRPGYRWAPSDVWPTAIEGDELVRCVRISSVHDMKETDEQDLYSKVQRLLSSKLPFMESTNSDKEEKEGKDGTPGISLQMSWEGSLEIQKPGFIIDQVIMTQDTLHLAEQEGSAWYSVSPDWASAPGDASSEKLDEYKGTMGLILSMGFSDCTKDTVTGALLRDVVGIKNLCSGTFLCRCCVQVRQSTKSEAYNFATGRRAGEDQTWIIS